MVIFFMRVYFTQGLMWSLNELDPLAIIIVGALYPARYRTRTLNPG
jgi:hypothetical protein